MQVCLGQKLRKIILSQHTDPFRSYAPFVFFYTFFHIPPELAILHAFAAGVWMPVARWELLWHEVQCYNERCERLTRRERKGGGWVEKRSERILCVKSEESSRAILLEQDDRGNSRDDLRLRSWCDSHVGAANLALFTLLRSWDRKLTRPCERPTSHKIAQNLLYPYMHDW